MPHAQDSSEVVVAGFGDIYVAPTGTALPTTSATANLNTAFTKLGFTTEDGVTLTRDPQVEEFMAWQSRSAIRRSLVAQDITLSFTLEQWNRDSFLFAFGGGTFTNLIGGTYRYDFVADTAALAEVALIVDFVDGVKSYRIVCTKGNVTDSIETQLVRTDLAVLPVTFKATVATAGASPAYFLTDDPAFRAFS